VGQTSPSDAAMERFISGDEPMTTVTVQIPTRLKRALKREAAEQDRTIKEILIDLLEVHFAANKQ
jgi:hypothetical protein